MANNKLLGVLVEKAQSVAVNGHNYACGHGRIRGLLYLEFTMENEIVMNAQLGAEGGGGYLKRETDASLMH